MHLSLIPSQNLTLQGMHLSLRTIAIPLTVIIALFNSVLYQLCHQNKAFFAYSSFIRTDFGVYIQFRTDGKLFNLRRLQARSRVFEELLREFLFADNCPCCTYNAVYHGQICNVHPLGVLDSPSVLGKTSVCSRKHQSSITTTIYHY